MDDYELQRSMNEETLAALREQGSDLRRTHNLQNVFHVYSAEDVSPLAEWLRDEGYQITEEGTKRRERRKVYYIVEARVGKVPDLHSLHSMTDCCTRIARQFNADYDGWYTEVVE